MSDAVTEIASEMHEAQPPVTAAPADLAPPDAAVPANTVTGDAAAYIPPGFNPALHEIDNAGNPVTNTDGSLRRKRGRKPARGPGGKFASNKQKPAAARPAVQLPPEDVPAATPEPAVVDAEPLPTSPEDAKRAATMVVGMGVGFCCGLFDQEEWKPDDAEEVTAIIDPLAEVFMRYDVRFGPEWAAAFAAVAYASKRIRKPKTWERLAGIRAKITALLFPWKR